MSSTFKRKTKKMGHACLSTSLKAWLNSKTLYWFLLQFVFRIWTYMKCKLQINLLRRKNVKIISTNKLRQIQNSTSTLRMEATGFSAASGQFYQTEQRHISEECYPQVKIKLWERRLPFSLEYFHLPVPKLNNISEVRVTFHGGAFA